MNDDNTKTHGIRPCPVCGKALDGIKTSRPLGRITDLYRVECECGNGELAMWSPTKAAAVRLWNWRNVDVDSKKRGE